MKHSIKSHIENNVLHTYLLMGGFTVVVVALSYIFSLLTDGSSLWLFLGVGAAFASNFVSYYWGDKIVLAMSHARKATREEFFDYYTVTENLCIAAGMPLPELYVIDDTALNAFATGRDPKHAVICATTGILDRLERRELEGVIAHELSHIKNYDIRLMVVVSVLVGTIAFLADMFLRNLWWGGNRNRDEDNRLGSITIVAGIVLAMITPFIATIIKLAISRNREYLADASGADITRYPHGLARALEKISSDAEVLEAATNATAHLYIANPFKGKAFGAWFANLFNTHPPIEERIKRLRNM